MRTVYVAEWYGEDALDREFDYFDPLIMERSEHTTLEAAKLAAFKGASRAGVGCVAYVCTRERDGVRTVRESWLVNECYRNKWSGWKARDYF